MSGWPDGVISDQLSDIQGTFILGCECVSVVKAGFCFQMCPLCTCGVCMCVCVCVCMFYSICSALFVYGVEVG